MTPSLTHVLTPLKIGGVEIRNRVARSAHGTRLALYDFDDLTAFHAARARGGVGLTFLELMSVHPTSPEGLSVFDPLHAEGMPRMMDTLRPLGMKVFQQINHSGNQKEAALDGSPPWSASNVPSVTHGVVPIAMTKAMIDEIIGAFADTARKCEQWGLDGVELHCCHSYLQHQFLSPLTNMREDDYGGSFENRARFTIETLTAIRSSVSKHFPISVRLAPDEAEAGFGVEDNAQLAEMLQARGLMDMLSVSQGSHLAFAKMIGGMHEPMGYEMATSAPITKRSKVPTMVIGRIRTLGEADAIIRAGEADIVGMARAHIADPDIVKKTVAGHPEQVRPCIGCNQGCLAGVLGPRTRLGCTVNIGAGWERTRGDHLLTVAPARRRVLVVGGGPAGMEAARVAAIRGHEVVLTEAAARLGGQINLAARAPTRNGIADITVWLEQEVYRLGVDVRLSSYMELADIAALKADAVIIATGSTPRMDGVQVSNPGKPIAGMEQSHVLSSADLFSNAERNHGRTALVIDDLGHFEAVAAAEYLQTKGLAVTYATRHASFIPLLNGAAMDEPALQRLMQRGNFTLHLRTRAVSIGKNEAVLAPVYLPLTTPHSFTVPADVVVYVSRNLPSRELYNGLQAQGVEAQVVGDANSPRFLLTAIHEGHAAATRV